MSCWLGAELGDGSCLCCVQWSWQTILMGVCFLVLLLVARHVVSKPSSSPHWSIYQSVSQSLNPDQSSSSPLSLSLWKPTAETARLTDTSATRRHHIICGRLLLRPSSSAYRDDMHITSLSWISFLWKYYIFVIDKISALCLTKKKISALWSLLLWIRSKLYRQKQD